MSKVNKKLFICFICVLTLTFSPKQVNSADEMSAVICPEHEFEATVTGTITETYAVYTYVRNPYPYCYYCKSYPATYLGYPFAGDYHPGGDGDCGCGSGIIDNTSQWYGVYKITTPTIKTDYRDVTIEFNGTVNHGDNPRIDTALDLGAAIPPEQREPIHDGKYWSGPPEQWREEVSMSLTFDLLVTHTNTDVTVAFSSPLGSVTTSNPAAHVLAWKPDNDCDIVPCLAGFVWIDTGYMHIGKLGYSVDEADLVYFFASDYVYTYNISSGQFGIDLTGITYFDWPFVYSADAGSWLFVFPPADGLHVYHNSTGQWCVLPRTMP